MNEHELSASVAVIGLAARFPGAADLDTLWRNLADGVESVSFFSPAALEAAGIDRTFFEHPRYVPARGMVEGVELFDAAFFGYSARDAEIIDPQQRLFLECSWEAVEHAGYDTTRTDARIGVYAGAGISMYLLNLLANEYVMETVGPYQVLLANDKDHLTTRVAYKLDLRGPAVTIQTTCSTSLVAVHIACQALLTYQCDMALAGGVTISLPQLAGYVYQEDGIFSPDGHCRAFDAHARGTVAGNGVGVVVLKRLVDALDDGDTIHAVIRGSAINNDGALKVGYTAPSVAGQAEVVAEALEAAGVDPATVSYIEAHGTGTSLGDPIEVAALARVFSQANSPDGCVIGSIKANIGHLDTASGIAGFIKTVLALGHRALPPSINFEEPNPDAPFADSPFSVNTRLVAWEPAEYPRRAGVSSFGMGGTNAHVVLEEAPPVAVSGTSRAEQLLVLSAATASALDALTTNLADHLRDQPAVSLADVAYTLQVGRRVLPHRRAVVCCSIEDAIAGLEHRDASRVFEGSDEHTDRRVTFMFPGQGAQRPGMAAELYQNEPVVRELVDECARMLQSELGFDIRSAIFPVAGTEHEAARLLRDTAVTQPALFVVEYVLARAWMEWGVLPVAMIGHSVGEYVAACLAGVFTLEDALRLVAARGRLMSGLPAGAMLSVQLPEADLRHATGNEVGIAAVNAPDLGVLSGSEQAISACEVEFAAAGVATRRLQTSHAFHSPLMHPIVEEYERLVARVPMQPPRLPMISNVTGTWTTDEQTTSAGYWARHLRSTVRFGDGIETVLDDTDSVLLEVGPGEILGTCARQCRPPARGRVVASLPTRPAAAVGGAAIPAAFAKLWLAGARIDWAQYHAGGQRRRVPLPTYPFERRRYWIDARGSLDAAIGPRRRDAAGEPAPERHERPDLPTPLVEPESDIERAVAGVWQETLGLDIVGRDDSFVDLGGHSLMATQITSRLRETFGVSVSLERFFELETVAAIALEIEDLLIAALENMSDDEVRRLSRSVGSD
ncbi:MAG: type I polyketide synthase [Actinomycetota bacterium]